MPRNLSLRHLRYFVAIADTGSFTVASSRLFITQSTLTATIQQFEETVGVKLFERTTRRVVLTPEGARFKGEAEKIISQFDGAIGDLQAFSDGRQGSIRVAAAPSVIDHFLADAIATFQLEYPNITFSLRDTAAERAEQLVSQGKIDFAISSRYKDKGMEDLVYTPLFEDHYGIICNQAHALAKSKGALRWQQLDPSGYVGFTADTGIGAFLREHSGNPALFEGPRNEISSTTSLHAILRSGTRYSIVPALSAASVGFSSFAFRELLAPRLSREMCLIARRLRALSPMSHKFIELLRQTMAAKPPLPGVRLLSPAGRPQQKAAAGRRISRP